VWAGVDSAWEQEKLEARKMLENAAESHMSGAHFVGQPHLLFLYYAIAVLKIRGSFQRLGLVIRSTSNVAIWRNTLPRETKAIGFGVSRNLA
jgi:hypothetical protein